MPYYRDFKRLHDSVVIQLARRLKTEQPSHKIIANPKFKKMGPLRLTNQKPFYPDIIDLTTHLAYEVHWKGERKEEPFDYLPEPWKGINVFIVDFDVPETIVVRMPGFSFARIENESFIKMLFKAKNDG